MLKLCLMKFGIGRWTQIHASGLLPGKLIGQLCGQAQRLLGQQSLASESGWGGGPPDREGHRAAVWAGTEVAGAAVASE